MHTDIHAYTYTHVAIYIFSTDCVASTVLSTEDVSKEKREPWRGVHRSGQNNATAHRMGYQPVGGKFPSHLCPYALLGPRTALVSSMKEKLLLYLQDGRIL